MGADSGLTCREILMYGAAGSALLAAGVYRKRVRWRRDHRRDRPTSRRRPSPNCALRCAGADISATELTQWYLDRIDQLNPLLHAVIETNPDALGIARQRDPSAGAGTHAAACTASRLWSRTTSPPRPDGDDGRIAGARR